MEKFLFQKLVLDWNYYFYKNHWNKIVNTKNILEISKYKLFLKLNLNTLQKQKYFEIFSFNLLSNFYKKKYPKKINNKFIYQIFLIINKLEIQLTQHQKEVLNYWRTIILARKRIKKKILVFFEEKLENNYSYFKISNIKCYLINKKNSLFKKENFNIVETNYFLNSMNEYKLLINGDLFFQRKALRMQQGITKKIETQFLNNKIFKYSNIKKIIITPSYVYVYVKNNIYIFCFPFQDTQLFFIYLFKIKKYWKKYNFKIIY